MRTKLRLHPTARKRLALVQRGERTGKQSNPNHPSKTLCLLCRNEDTHKSWTVVFDRDTMRSRSSTRVMANPPSTDPFVRSVSQMSFRFHASFTKYVLYFCFRRRRSFVCRPLEPTPLGRALRGAQPRSASCPLLFSSLNLWIVRSDCTERLFYHRFNLKTISLHDS